jgi:hypothetical protein
MCTVFIFRYVDYGEPPDGTNKYGITDTSLLILVFRLAFVVVFWVSVLVRNLMCFYM